MRTIDGDDDSYDYIDKTWGKIWRNADGQFHRDDDLPALIRADGSVVYYKDGCLHRDGDLPAVIFADGSVSYYRYDRKQSRWRASGCDSE